MFASGSTAGRWAVGTFIDVGATHARDRAAGICGIIRQFNRTPGAILLAALPVHCRLPAGRFRPRLHPDPKVPT